MWAIAVECLPEGWLLKEEKSRQHGDVCLRVSLGGRTWRYDRCSGLQHLPLSRQLDMMLFISLAANGRILQLE